MIDQSPRDTWLDELARTGRLLSEARAQIDARRYQQLLRETGIDRQEAADSITLFENLDTAKQAEIWNQQRGGRLPDNVHQVVMLLGKFRRNLN